MFIRAKKSGSKNSPRDYLQIVESFRDGHSVRQRVICTLGRLDLLQESGHTPTSGFHPPPYGGPPEATRSAGGDFTVIFPTKLALAGPTRIHRDPVFLVYVRSRPWKECAG